MGAMSNVMQGEKQCSGWLLKKLASVNRTRMPTWAGKRQRRWRALSPKTELSVPHIGGASGLRTGHHAAGARLGEFPAGQVIPANV